VSRKDENGYADVPGVPTSAIARYVLAGCAAVAGVLLTTAISEAAPGEPIFAPLLVAVALAGWYGGFAPAALAVVVGWGLVLALLVDRDEGVSYTESEDFTRWWVNLAVAVLIGGFLSLLRSRQERVTGELASTRTTMEEIESLQQLSIALGVALSSDEVTSTLASHAPRIVGAAGVVVGLLDGDDVLVVERTGIAAERVSGDGLRIPLGRTTLLTRAAHEGTVARASGRRPLESATPDSAALVFPGVESAFAVPLRASRGEIVGALGFVFGHEDGAGPELVGVAQIVADLAGQALERARFYEREREARQALDRIVQLAPRFPVDDDRDDILESVCREARLTFGADYGVLWRVADGSLELLAIDPAPPTVSVGVRLSLGDFPQLGRAIRTLGTSFVPDVRESTHGDGRAFVERMGIRSSLRTPVVIGGSSELVLAVSWQVVVSEPDASTRALMRRFADQAGLVLEQLERRRAEAEASRRADATRRLQRVTAALSTAATPFDVSSTCLESALESLGAESGFVVLAGPHGARTVELVTSTGYDDDELEAWRGLGLDDEVPFARAISSGRSVWALEAQDMAEFRAVTEPRSTGWITIPLRTRRGYVGALHVSLRTSRPIGDDEREWLEDMVSQCGLALERSELYDDEQRTRARAELLGSMTARLSNALTPADVADVAVDEVVRSFGASSAVLAGVADGAVADVLAATGEEHERLEALLDLRPSMPGGHAARALRPVVVDDRDALEARFPTLARSLEPAFRERTFLALPFVAARRLNGLLLASWDTSHALPEEDRAVLESLAGQAAQALDRAGRYETEQAIAETLQRSVLPDSLPRVEGVQLAARYLPGSTQLDVGGDWFDALTLPDGKLGLVVGDVVGKGVRAAASMAQLRNAIRAFSVERLKPSSAIARLNRLCMDVLDAAFATVVYMTVDPTSGACRISSAGHPPPLVAYPDGRVELLEGARGLPLGTAADAKYRQQTIDLPAGSVLLLYTDGLVERRGASIDDGLAAVRSAVERAPSDPDRLLDHIIDALVGGREREDDIAILAARLLPVAPRPLDLTIRSDVGSMGLVRDAMRMWLSGTTLDRTTTEGVVLATWEACANAVEHAVAPTQDVVHVRADTYDSRLRVVIEDSGGWSPPSETTERGFGLRLIEALVSSAAVTHNAPGTTVVLEQTLVAEPAEVD
jgi:serine phosphatase RsbU (regulator of sigma subunit)/anti-sigma regulatory factor (Ser/Thr protein kinase)